MLMLKRTAPSVEPKALTKLSGDVILRELPATDVIKYVAILLDRLAKLYQQQNWNAENSVILAEWILDTYPCEMMQTVDKILRKPPKSDGPNWRLTPDTVQKWMEDELENLAMLREHFNHSKKYGDGNTKPVEGLEELYNSVKQGALKAHETKEEIKKMQREDRTRRYGPVDLKAIEERDKNQQP